MAPKAGVERVNGATSQKTCIGGQTQPRSTIDAFRLNRPPPSRFLGRPRFGLLLGGYVVEWTGSLVSIFHVAMGCHVRFALFVCLVVPESTSKRWQLAAWGEWQRSGRGPRRHLRGNGG